MPLLDSREEIVKIDQHNLLGSVEQLPEQIKDAWEQTRSLSLPASYSAVKRAVVSGMGGSALGAHVLKHLYHQDLSLPLEVVSGYHLPGYVDSDTLVVLSSYSGTTQETLSAAAEAIAQGAKIAVITSGGELAKLASQHQWPTYLIDPAHNPSGQPRMAIGYAVIGLLAFFNNLGIVSIAEADLHNLVNQLHGLVKKLGVEVGEGNTAKLLAYNAFDKALVFCASEHLVGAAHISNNQVNENAKTLTAEWPLPEFNHHYLEALSNPGKLRDDVHFFFYQSHLYTPEVGKRVELTRTLVEKLGYSVDVIQATAPTKLEQVFEVITLGAFFNFYLSILYKSDPAPIPHVDWFKEQMKK